MRESRKAYRKYQEFHGKHPKAQGAVDFPEPEELVCLGDAVEIVYRTDKRNGGGDGKPCDYVHKFAPGAKLFMDETGRHWLFIHGPRIVVKEPGIIN